MLFATAGCPKEKKVRRRQRALSATMKTQKGGDDMDFGPDYSMSLDLPEKSYSVDIKKEFGISPSSSDRWPEGVYELEYTDAWGDVYTVRDSF